jgi:hypothetical protein
MLAERKPGAARGGAGENLNVGWADVSFIDGSPTLRLMLGFPPIKSGVNPTCKSCYFGRGPRIGTG